jgi:hypothetical protein
MDDFRQDKMKEALNKQVGEVKELANILTFTFNGEEFDAVVDVEEQAVEVFTKKGKEVACVKHYVVSTYDQFVEVLLQFVQDHQKKKVHRHEQIELTKTAGAVANTILEMILAEVRPLYPEARFGHRSQGVEEAAVAILAYGIEVRLNDGWLSLRWSDDWLRLLLPKYEDPAFQPKVVVEAVVSALKRIEEQKRMEGMVFKELAKLGTVDPQGTTNDVQKILEKEEGK